MAVGLNEVTLEFETPVETITDVSVSFEEEQGELIVYVMMETAQAEVYKCEIQAIIDALQDMIDSCNIARSQMFDKE